MRFRHRRILALKSLTTFLIILLCCASFFIYNQDKETTDRLGQTSLLVGDTVIKPALDSIQGPSNKETQNKEEIKAPNVAVELPDVHEVHQAIESVQDKEEHSIESYRLDPNCMCFGDVETVSLEIETCVKASCVPKLPTVCEPHGLIGPVEPQWSDLTMSYLVRKGDLRFVKTGGWWSPEDCKSNHHVAIIIPVRDRDQQLPVLLRHLLPILQRRNNHFSVFVVEQNKKDGFNKGKLLNVGFKEAQKFFPYTCFVFHDVDLLVESDDVSYGCEQSPMHVSSRIDRLKYKLLYDYMTSGVQMFTKADYELINGFSNSFWHKGGEDDNLFDRINDKNLKLKRQGDIKFTELKQIHKKAPENAPFLIGGDRLRFNAEAKKYMSDDGLNNLHYKVEYSDERTLYTYIRVDLLKNEDKEFGKFQYGKDDLWTKISKERANEMKEKSGT